MKLTPRAAFLFISLLPGFLPDGLATLEAQAAPSTGVAGLVVQAGADSQPLSGAEIELVQVQGTAVYRRSSDGEGRFRITVEQPGRYRLSVARIAYDERVIEDLELTRGEIVRITVELEPRPVALDNLLVRAEGAAPPEFWERKQRLGDKGHFITPEYIEDTYPQLTFILRDAPGVHAEWGGYNTQVRFRNPGAGGGQCIPAIYLNGVPIPEFASLTEYVNVEDIVAVEVYRSNSFAPEGYTPEWGCGLVLMWVRSTPPDKSALIPALLLLGLAYLIGALVL